MLPVSRIFLCITIAYHFPNAQSLLGEGWDLAGDEKFPFIVSLGQDLDDPPKENPYGFICGGALITERHVLTAASCCSAGEPPSDYFVWVGSSYLGFTFRHFIESWITYDTWFEKGGRKDSAGIQFNDHDIAIIKLVDRAVVIRGPIPVWKHSLEEIGDRKVMTAGWGNVDWDIKGPLKNQVMADVELITRPQCRENLLAFPGNEGGSIQPMHQANFFCTIGARGNFIGLDEYDRGSPIFIKLGDKYEIIGVNQKAVPRLTESMPIEHTALKQNKHIFVHPYLEFIRSNTILS